MKLLDVEQCVSSFTPKFRKMYSPRFSYDSKKYGVLLSFHCPEYVGMFINSIKEIEESEVCIRIATVGAVVTFWKDVECSHVSILE